MTQISDEEILDMIVKGIIVLYPTGIYKFHNKNKKFYKIKEQEHPISKRIRFDIGINSRRRTIYRNKLIWMLTHKKVVPNGYDIDHKDGINTNDSPNNLQLRISGENRADNTTNAFKECVDFFNRCLAKQYGSKGDF